MIKATKSILYELYRFPRNPVLVTMQLMALPLAVVALPVTLPAYLLISRIVDPPKERHHYTSGDATDDGAGRRG